VSPNYLDPTVNSLLFLGQNVKVNQNNKPFVPNPSVRFTVQPLVMNLSVQDVANYYMHLLQKFLNGTMTDKQRAEFDTKTLAADAMKVGYGLINVCST